MHPRHLIVKGMAPSASVRNRLTVETFLKKTVKTLGETSVLPPTTVERKGTHAGLTAVVITNWSHIVVHSFFKKNLVLCEFCTCETTSLAKIQSLFIDHFKIDVRSVKSATLISKDLQPIECQEPSCVRLATNDYKGMKVCPDHLQMHMDRHFEQHKETGAD